MKLIINEQRHLLTMKRTRVLCLCFFNNAAKRIYYIFSWQRQRDNM